MANPSLLRAAVPLEPLASVYWRAEGDVLSATGDELRTQLDARELGHVLRTWFVPCSAPHFVRTRSRPTSELWLSRSPTSTPPSGPHATSFEGAWTPASTRTTFCSCCSSSTSATNTA